MHDESIIHLNIKLRRIIELMKDNKIPIQVSQLNGEPLQDCNV